MQWAIGLGDGLVRPEPLHPVGSDFPRPDPAWDEVLEDDLPEPWRG